MEIENSKDRNMAIPKDAEFNGKWIIEQLMQSFKYDRRQTLAELLEVEDRTLTNWSEKTYAQLNKQSASLKILFDTVTEFEKADIPKSAWLKLLRGELVGEGKTLMQAINSEPDNQLLRTVIRLFTEKYFIEVSKSTIEKGMREGKLTDDDRQRIRAKYKKA